MTAQDFCRWLQGFFELRDADPELKGKPLTAAQAEMVREHLALVFTKVTGAPKVEVGPKQPPPPEPWPHERPAHPLVQYTDTFC